MKVQITEKVTHDIKIMRLSAGVRYWEDAMVNGVEDTDGELMPFIDGDNWVPDIDVETGIIVGWPIGTTADIHYKVCDCFSFSLINENGSIVFEEDNAYVPNDLIPGEFGDYIIMSVDGFGKIAEWNFDFEAYINS